MKKKFNFMGFANFIDKYKSIIVFITIIVVGSYSCITAYNKRANELNNTNNEEFQNNYEIEVYDYEENPYIYYVDQQFNVPELPIVYENEDLLLSQYKDFTINDVPEYSVSMDETEEYIKSTMSKYAESIGEDPETYVYDKSIIENMSFGECSSYDELKQYLYKIYNENAKSSWETNRKYACFYTVVKNSKIDENSKDWIEFYEKYKKNYELMAISYGFENLYEYAKANGMSDEYIEDMIYDNAMIEYKTPLIYNLIAELEGYKTDIDSIKDIIKNNASMLDMTYDEYIKNYMTEEDIESRIKEDFVQTIIFDSVEFK